MPATARLAAKVLLVVLLEEGNREVAVEASAGWSGAARDRQEKEAARIRRGAGAGGALQAEAPVRVLAQLGVVSARGDAGARQQLGAASSRGGKGAACARAAVARGGGWCADLGPSWARSGGGEAGRLVWLLGFEPPGVACLAVRGSCGLGRAGDGGRAGGCRPGVVRLPARGAGGLGLLEKEKGGWSCCCATVVAAGPAAAAAC